MSSNSTDGFTHLRTKEDAQEDGTPPNSPDNSSPDSTPAKPKKSTYTYGNASAGATACHAEESVMNSASLNLGIETYKCKPLYSIVSRPRVILCRDWLIGVT